MSEPSRAINTPAGIVEVRPMSADWMLNQCVSAHPVRASEARGWAHHDRCSRLSVPGDEMSAFFGRVHDRWGSPAVLAWHGDLLLGHLVFLPAPVAREAGVDGVPGEANDRTIIVVNLALCSLSGHRFRRAGIGSTMVAMMLDMASARDADRLFVPGVGGGLFPADWLDHCIPPRPFWERHGFAAVAHSGPDQFDQETLDNLLSDNPRASDEEQERKRRLIADIHAGRIDQSRYAGSFDMQLNLANYPERDTR